MKFILFTLLVSAAVACDLHFNQNVYNYLNDHEIGFQLKKNDAVTFDGYSQFGFGKTVNGHWAGKCKTPCADNETTFIRLKRDMIDKFDIIVHRQIAIDSDISKYIKYTLIFYSKCSVGKKKVV